MAAPSRFERFVALPPELRAATLAEMEDHTVAQLMADWTFWAREDQLAQKWAWRFWAIITGRGWGKNRTAAEWVLDRCQAFADARAYHLIGLFARDKEDVHALMLGGISGIVACAERRGWRVWAPPSSDTAAIFVPQPDGSEHRSDIEVHTSMDPDGARGRNFATVWADEFASWHQKIDREGNTAWSNMNLSLRAECPRGMVPQAVVTTTPKPIPPVKDMLDGKLGPTVVTRGSMMDNRANLAEGFIDAILTSYEGTRLASQEIHGEVLTSVEGALWDMDLIHRWRVRWDQVPRLAHIVIAVDPSGSEGGDECGIVAVGRAAELDAKGRKHIYVIEDRSVRNRPAVWGPEVIRLRNDLEELFPGVRVTVAAEINYGGQMVVDTIAVRDPSIHVDNLVASKAKRIRAEPVATLYDTGRAHHVGVFPQLEEQMVWWTPIEPTSPDRMDGLVWAAIGLLPELVQMMAGYSPGFADRHDR
jgi:phage terminase large subunit-like protein